MLNEGATARCSSYFLQLEVHGSSPLACKFIFLTYNQSHPRSTSILFSVEIPCNNHYLASLIVG